MGLNHVELEHKYGAHNYHPLNVVIEKARGIFVWDVNNKKYFDFLSAYSAVNQGHCHPKIIEALITQSKNLTLTSRAFYNSMLGPFEKEMTALFGFDKVLPMNTGVEGVETAIKISRKWGYESKKIKEDQAKIIVFEGNFHGRTSTVISFSDDENARKNFGPFSPGFIKVPYNDITALKATIKEHAHNLAGVLVEPIQGEAGVNVPDRDFIREIRELCTQNNILFIVDEIQTGIARTGSFLSVCGDCSCTNRCMQDKNYYVKPDILILGKAISGGVYPVSLIFADNHIMDLIKPGQHGSTFGGNPLAVAVVRAALQVVFEEDLMQKARELGIYFRKKISDYAKKSNILLNIRGKGLLNAILINDTPESDTAWNICVRMKEYGLLAKPTHGNIIRLAPPLVIKKEDLDLAIKIILKTLREFEN